MFSPDGQQIAFTRWGMMEGIYLINADGSNERQVQQFDIKARFDTILSQLKLKAATGQLAESDLQQVNALLEE